VTAESFAFPGARDTAHFGVEMLKRRGFTLVELLIVVAILALLLALVLSATAGMRNAGRWVSCANNMRQIGLAWFNYAISNHDGLPMTGRASSASPYRSEEAFHWQAGRDPNRSALAPYLGNPLNLDLFRCPSDDMTAGTRSDLDGRYEYSYSMNVLIASPPADVPVANRNPEMIWTMNLHQIKEPSQKIVIVDESYQTINDFAWAPKIMPVGAPSFPRVDWISSRHGRHSDKVLGSSGVFRPATYFEDGGGVDPEGKSNAIFADGHVELFTRRFAHDEKHYHPLN
jgi:prepilin-type N-terminal cleavage/methylation domain-containing protein/prepilin-type processing-associated H-X9-DG protein